MAWTERHDLVGDIGDEKLPSYVGIIINHYKDPSDLLPQPRMLDRHHQDC